MPQATGNSMAMGLLALAVASVCRADEVTFVHQGQTITVQGNVLAQDSAQTILFEGRDSQHYIIAASERQAWKRDPNKVKPYTARELRAAMEAEFGPTFRVVQSNNYTIVHSCADTYAEDAKKLFENVHSVFRNYFRSHFKFTEHEQPLVAVIFATRDEYIRYMLPLIGPLAGSTAGVYIPRTNRMYMFDAVGGWGEVLNVLGQRNPNAATQARLELVKQNISTVVHEAVHQVAYNSGFHDRHVQNPLWLVEGMAMLFESPKLQRRNGWGGPEDINIERAQWLRSHPGGRGPERLQRMILEDSAFQVEDTALDMYAEAWGFTYFLVKRFEAQYAEYISFVNAVPAMRPYTAEERLEHFRKAFGQEPKDMWEEYDRFQKKSVMTKL